MSPEYQQVEQYVREAVRSGITCREVADCVFNAIPEERFYILTEPNLVKPMVQMRMEDILQKRNPTNPMPKLEI